MQESRTRRLTRYAIVAAIVAVLGGLYVQREILTDDAVAVPAAAVATDAAATADSTVAADASNGEGATGDRAAGASTVAVGLLDDRSVELDELAPDFRLTDMDGRAVMLSDFRGKTVVLNFWASWCPPCRAEMPEFQELWEARGEHGADDLVILAVNFLRDDTVGAATKFVEGQGFTFPVVFDTTSGDVAARYGVRGLPATFFIDRKGVVRTTALGPVFGRLLETGVADADTEGGTVLQ